MTDCDFRLTDFHGAYRLDEFACTCGPVLGPRRVSGQKPQRENSKHKIVFAELRTGQSPVPTRA